MILNNCGGEGDLLPDKLQRVGLTMRGLIFFSGMTAIAVGLSGCAGAGAGDPGARSLPTGQSCQTIRGELNRLDSKGVPSLVERSGSGGKLNPAQRAEVDQYNGLLNQYLGARCHV